MKQAPLVLDNASARRIFLHAHGLSHDPAGHDGDILSLIRRLGFVQLDSIQTVARAHHHILHTRSAAYRPTELTRLQHDQRALFEHWTHDASVIPVEHYPHWRVRFAKAKRHARASPDWAERLGSRRILKRILDRIEAGGAVMARDFEDPGTPGEMWGWSRSKSALEYLWRVGILAIPRRDSGFQKVYDLSERIIPDDIRLATPSKAATVDWACRAALERLGFATPREIYNFWALIAFDDVQRWIDRNRKRLVNVSIEGVDGGHVSALALPEIEQHRDTAPQPPAIMRALNPFDPAIRDRKRLKRLFGFDYTIEIFVPEAKRKFGYYVYPLLYGDRLVGRVDAKTDRAAEALAVKKTWLEKGVRADAGFKARQAAALADLASFGGTKRVIRTR